MDSTINYIEAKNLVFVAWKEQYAAKLPKDEEQYEEVVPQQVKILAQPIEGGPVSNRSSEEQITAKIDVLDFLNQLPKQKRC